MKNTRLSKKQQERIKKLFDRTCKYYANGWGENEWSFEHPIRLAMSNLPHTCGVLELGSLHHLRGVGNVASQAYYLKLLKQKARKVKSSVIVACAGIYKAKRNNVSAIKAFKLAGIPLVAIAPNSAHNGENLCGLWVVHGKV